MVEFIRDHIVLIVILCFAYYIAMKILRKVRNERRVNRLGVDAEAAVTWIEEITEVDGKDYITYVTFYDQDGKRRESVMDVSAFAGVELGDLVKIKYIPGEYDVVRYVETINRAELE